MIKEMITEEDIFLYSLYPEELDPDKIAFIKANAGIFKNQLDFCKSLHAQIRLFPMNISAGEKKKIKFAASSGNSESEPIAYTYSDSSSEFLFKIQLVKKEFKAYLYRQNSRVYDFKIKFLPQDIEFEIDENNSVLPAMEFQQISEVQIKP